MTAAMQLQNATIQQQQTTIQGLTDMLTPYPVFSKLRVGNQIFGLYQTSLPVQKIQRTLDTRCTPGPNGTAVQFPFGSSVGGRACGYADTPYLSLETNYLCGSNMTNDMYHLHFEGHIFRDSESFSCQAVGYLYGARGHTFAQTNCNDDFPTTSNLTMQLTSYCAPQSGNLVFRFFDPNWAADRWHASDLLVNYVGGGGSYIGRGADTLQIIDAAMHITPQVF